MIRRGFWLTAGAVSGIWGLPACRRRRAARVCQPYPAEGRLKLADTRAGTRTASR